MEKTKINGGCRGYLKKKLHKILLVTLEEELIDRWENLPLAGVRFNGWQVKKWEGFEVIGQYCPSSWIIKKGQFILSHTKCLELWVPAEFPLVKKLMEDLHSHIYPRICPECVYAASKKL
jgi:hypothetical protein